MDSGTAAGSWETAFLLPIEIGDGRLPGSGSSIAPEEFQAVMVNMREHVEHSQKYFVRAAHTGKPPDKNKSLSSGAVSNSTSRSVPFKRSSAIARQAGLAQRIYDPHSAMYRLHVYQAVLS